MLLNKIPCLDKGYVAFVDSCNPSKKLTDLALEFMRSNDWLSLKQISSLTLVIKCPLFVQLNLSKFDLQVVNTPMHEVETYCPNAGEIGGPDRQLNEDIADDMHRTAEALLINPKAYQKDGCDRFVSQILTPISAYTTLIVHGSYPEWLKFCAQLTPPPPLVSYINAVQQVMKMEWQ